MKLLAAALCLTVFTVGAAAQSSTSEVKGHQWQDLDQRTNAPFEQVGALDRVFDNFLSVFSSGSGQTTFDVGEDITVEHFLTSSLEAESVDAADTILVVETYKCHDSGCDDPFEDKLITNGHYSWRTDTDAIGNFGSADNYRGQVTLPGLTAGLTLKDPVTGSTSTLLEPEGTYATVVYVVDTAENRVISEVWSSENQNEDWRFRFDVTNTQDGTDGPTDGSGSTSQPAEIIADQHPEVTAKNGQVSGTVYLKNSGGTDMAETHIVEMQVRPKGKSLLSFVGQQQICDESHQEIVNKKFRLDAGDTRRITLQTDAVEPGQKYTVYFVTGTDCYPDGQRTYPYGNGLQAGTVCVGDCTSSSGPHWGRILLVLGGLTAALIGVVVVIRER